MLSTLLLVAAFVLPFSIGGYFALRRAYRVGYTDGVADLQLTLENALQQQFGKEAPRA